MPIYDDRSDLDPRLRCRGCGRVHLDARLVNLPDGRVVGSYSEELRRYNEASWVLRKKRSKRARIEYLDGVEAKRGEKAREALREEMLKLWEGKKK